jgi:hypothetical protein
MSRPFRSSLLLAALAAVPACKGAASDPLKLVPSQASVLAAVDVKGLMSSKLYSDNRDQLETGEAKEMIEALKACNVDQTSLERLTVGADPASEGVVVVVSGKGLGKADTLTCVAGKVKEKSGKDPWTLEEKDGAKTLNIGEGEAVGYLVSDDLVAVASANWAGAVKELIDGKGAAAVDGNLKALVGRAPKDKPLWFAGLMPADAAAGLKGTPGENVKDFSGGLDLANGLAFALAAGVGTPESATALKDELQKQFDQFKGLAVAGGVPQPVIDSVKIAAEADAVTLAAALTHADIDALKQKLGGMIPGMGGGPLGAGGPPPAMPMDPPPPVAAEGAPEAPAGDPAAAPAAPEAPSPG